MMSRKAQSALEYLMTYGWAILIVVIVGAVLFSLGVFNPSATTAMQVRGLDNFYIEDALLKPAGNLSIILGVKTGRTTNVSNIDFSVIGLSCINNDDSPDVILPPSQTRTILLPPSSACSLVFGSQVTISVNITYASATGGLTHIDTGQILITVQQ